MSGPKIDEATLARQKAELLEKERRERAEALSKHFGRIFLIRTQMQIMKQEYQILIKKIKGISDLSYACTDIEEILVECAHKIEAAITTVSPLIMNSDEDQIKAPKINNLSMQMNENCKTIFCNTEGNISAPVGRIREYLQQKQNIEEKNKVYKDLVNLHPQLLNALDKFEFNKLHDHKSDSDRTKLFQISKTSLLSQIEDITSMDYVCFEDRKWLEGIRHSMEDEMSESDILNIANQFLIHKSTILQNREEFAKTFLEYQAEIALLSKISGEELKTSDVCNFASLLDLKAEISRIRNRQAEIENRKYIRKTIEKVMKKRGYRLQQDVIFSEKDVMKHTIFAVPGVNSAGITIAIHTRYSQNDNTVMFEVIGADANLFDGKQKCSEPILINSMGSKSIENTDKNSLLLRMQEELCPEFDEIRKECEKEGVVLKNKLDKRPDAKYNSLISVKHITGTEMSDDIAGQRDRSKLQHRVQTLK